MLVCRLTILDSTTLWVAIAMFVFLRYFTAIRYDHGVSADEMPRGAFPRLNRREHCTTVYKSNILGRVPNSMRVVLGGDDGMSAARAL